MPMPFTSDQIQEIYGVLRSILYQDCSAADMRIIAGEAGWDLGSLPTGLNDSGYTLRPAISSAIDGYWSQWDESVKIKRLRLLANALSRHFEKRMDGRDFVNKALANVGFRFANGEFVPVDAAGKVPE